MKVTAIMDWVMGHPRMARSYRLCPKTIPHIHTILEAKRSKSEPKYLIKVNNEIISIDFVGSKSSQ